MSDEHEAEAEDTGSDIGSPDFESASDVCRWYGEQVITLVNRARRKESLTKLRALASALDVWRRLYELSAQTSELETLKQRLESLEGELRSGPQGIVKR